VETSLNCLSAPKATMDAADVIPIKLFESRNLCSADGFYRGTRVRSKVVPSRSCIDRMVYFDILRRKLLLVNR
jgi:hypothetical protein